MKRLHSLVLLLALSGALWVFALTPAFPVKLDERVRFIVTTLPLYSLIIFGAYSLFSIGHALFTFRDCPEAFTEMQQDIARARSELTKKGFKFD